MEISGAMQVIKKDLESTFGNTMTASVVAIARGKANAPLIGMTKDHFMALVDAIISDNRVQAMWGAAGAREKASNWKRLVG